MAWRRAHPHSLALPRTAELRPGCPEQTTAIPRVFKFHASGCAGFCVLLHLEQCHGQRPLCPPDTLISLGSLITLLAAILCHHENSLHCKLLPTEPVLYSRVSNVLPVYVWASRFKHLAKQTRETSRVAAEMIGPASQSDIGGYSQQLQCITIYHHAARHTSARNRFNAA